MSFTDSQKESIMELVATILDSDGASYSYELEQREVAPMGEWRTYENTGWVNMSLRGFIGITEDTASARRRRIEQSKDGFTYHCEDCGVGVGLEDAEGAATVRCDACWRLGR